MAYELTVGGYTFENPPEEYRKLARLSNSPQTAFNRKSTAFYQSDSQDLQFQVDGTLALDPTLGGTDDLAELEKLQQIAIEGGEVQVEFDPFFTGKCVIEDDPFRQESGESSYKFTFTVNSESTDDSAYPAHSAPDTGNTFEFGDLDLGYDPNQVQQNYERQTEKVKRLQGIARSVDTEGLIPKVKISGMIDGGGQANLWKTARSNTLAYLSAEFQNGWVLVDSLSIRNSPEAPDYLTGMFQYDLDLLVVMDPGSGIGEVSKYVDRDVQDSSTYVSNCDEDGIFERLGDDTEDYPDALDYRVSGGTGKLDGDYIEWPEDFGTLDQNATNYIWAEDGDGDGYGQVNRGTSGFPGNTVPLFEVDTGTSSVNDIRDTRSCLTGTRFSDDELGDLNFRSDLAVSDQQFSFERLLAISDQMAVSGSTLPWMGLAGLTDSLSLGDGTLTFRGISTLSDSVAVVDGGSTGSGVSETVAWETETDWDSAVSETDVVHPSDVVELATSNSTYIDLAHDDGQVGNIGNSSSDFYSMSFVGNGSDASRVGVWLEEGNSEGEVRVAICPDDGGGRADALNPLWESSLIDPGSTGQWFYRDIPGVTLTDGKRYHVVIDGYQNGGTGYSNVGLSTETTSTNENFYYSNDGGGSWTEYSSPFALELETSGGSSYVSSGSLTTATKSFSQPFEPDLDSLVYSLNGESATLDVIGSPTLAGEEIQSITLDGATSYTIAWNSSHTDFRIKINLSSGGSNTPTVDSLPLAIFSSNDEDQNPNTQWEILGAKYDTGGNEYEGGGITARYGG
jgi:hypothetical protein